MKDLLGDNIPDTPAMTDKLPYVVYVVYLTPMDEDADCAEIWAAQTIEQVQEAVTDCMEHPPHLVREATAEELEGTRLQSLIVKYNKCNTGPGAWLIYAADV